MEPRTIEDEPGLNKECRSTCKNKKIGVWHAQMSPGLINWCTLVLCIVTCIFLIHDTGLNAFSLLIMVTQVGEEMRK